MEGKYETTLGLCYHSVHTHVQMQAFNMRDDGYVVGKLSIMC